MAYDAFGRQPKQYLPFAAAGNSGAFVNGAQGRLTSYYGGLASKQGNPFTTTTFEASPLNGPLTQTAPGQGTAAQLAYRTNTPREWAS